MIKTMYLMRTSQVMR